MEMTLTIIGALLTGGIGVTLLNRFGMSKKDESDYMLMLVRQLQDSVNANNEEIKILKVEVSQWREKYYTELEQKNKLADEVRQLRLQLQKFNQTH